MIRAFEATDPEFAEIADLLNEDGLTGQPLVTVEMVRATLTRRAPVDQRYYEQLVETHVLVARDNSGIIGAVAYGAARTGVRDLLWLAARRCEAITILIDTVLADWPGPSHAFWYASTVSAGLEGLPRTHRRDVDTALVARGFHGKDLRSYQVLEVVNPRPHSDVGFTTQAAITDDSGREVARYVADLPFEGLGVLWWIEVDEAHRRRGYGRRAIGEALSVLAAHGARRVILYVDDDDRTGERDRGPAKALYARVGFREVDRLWSYARGDLPPDPALGASRMADPTCTPDAPPGFSVDPTRRRT